MKFENVPSAKIDLSNFNASKHNQVITAAVREFRNKLKDINMTPEGFFRYCDTYYEKKVLAEDFIRQVRRFNLPISEKSLHYLKLIFDEDQNGVIE